jgi:hypothetical protein
MSPLMPQLVVGQGALVCGFRGGPESDDECGTVGRGNPLFPSCLDLGPLANEEGLGASSLNLARLSYAPQ